MIEIIIVISGTRACGSGYSDTALIEVCDKYMEQNVQAVARTKDCLGLPRVQVEIVGESSCSN